jgi:hypothetical protein
VNLPRKKIKVLLSANLETEFVFLKSVSAQLNTGVFEIFFANELYKVIGNSSTRYSEAYAHSLICKICSAFKLGFVKSFFDAFSKYFLAHRILRESQPDIIILGTDSAYFSLFIVKKAKDEGIPVVVMPFSMCNQTELTSYVKKNVTYRVPQKGLLALFLKLLPSKWFITNDGIRYICYAQTNPLIQEILSISPRDPWLICGGNSDYVFVGSQFEARFYMDSGVQLDKIKLYSQESRSEKNEPSTQEQFDVLWSVPPDHINNELFSSFEEMVEWHLNIFEGEQLKVLLSPHPRIPQEKLNSFLISESQKVSYLPIKELIPNCKYFIASQSATIRFALAKKRIILNFRIYDLPYSEYSNMPMVKEVSSKEDFVSFVKILKSGSLNPKEVYEEFSIDFFEAKDSNLNGLLLELMVEKPTNFV